MKRYLSVVMIVARTTIYPMIGLLLLMSMVDVAVFQWMLQRMVAGGGICSLEVLIQQSKIEWIWAATFVILCAFLEAAETEGQDSKSRYTMRRLSVDEKVISLLWCGYNVICFVICFALQIVTVLLLCDMYASTVDPVFWNEQTTFLAFYRDQFLHSLLPLDEISLWIRNIALMWMAGACIANISSDRPMRSVAYHAGIYLIVIGFPQYIGRTGANVFMTVFAVVCFVAIVFWGKQYED
ncbi:MAG: hypothetical protein RR053_02445 [Evtepia sp.]